DFQMADARFGGLSLTQHGTLSRGVVWWGKTSMTLCDGTLDDVSEAAAHGTTGARGRTDCTVRPDRGGTDRCAAERPVAAAATAACLRHRPAVERLLSGQATRQERRGLCLHKKGQRAPGPRRVAVRRLPASRRVQSGLR